MSLRTSIQRIQIQTNHLAKDLLAGLYRSAFKGHGLEFEEVREYQPGDEVRSIDWPVTSHMNTAYVKLFREERELTVILLVDVSHSTLFGGAEQTKKELITEIAAVIAFSAIRNNDKVGLILFAGEVEKYIPPSNSVRHVLRVIRELLSYKAKTNGTNIAKALQFLGNVHHRSCVCFLFSDFITSDFSKEVAVIAKRHDLIGVAIADPLEESLPTSSYITLRDLESGKTLLAGPQPNLKEDTRARIAAQKKMMQRIGAGFIELHTNRDYIPVLKKFFNLRSRLRK